MKPLNRNNYGSIPHLSISKLGEGEHYITQGQENILTLKKRDKYDYIYSYEKYDGSNVGICKVNNKIFALTRAGYDAKTSPYKQHYYFYQWVQNNEKLFIDMLNESERITGEWMIQAHGMRYNIKDSLILFFDYFTSNNERLLQSELKSICDNYNLFMPRLLCENEPHDLDYLLPILSLKTKEFESENDPEGIVFRVERKGKVDFLAKWIRNDYLTGQYLIDENNLIWNINLETIPLNVNHSFLAGGMLSVRGY